VNFFVSSPTLRAPAKSRFVLICPMTSHRGRLPRDRVGLGREPDSAIRRFGYLVQNATLPGPCPTPEACSRATGRQEPWFKATGLASQLGILAGDTWVVVPGRAGAARSPLAHAHNLEVILGMLGR
jgi:hypothetical protein